MMAENVLIQETKSISRMRLQTKVEKSKKVKNQ